MPQFRDNLSAYMSPMLAMARLIKEEDPGNRVVFIGPCIAKKGEARESRLVDAVLTFEELAAILVAAGINLAELQGDHVAEEGASSLGYGFAAAGGVVRALLSGFPGEKQKEVNAVKAEGIVQCIQVLEGLKTGKTKAEYLEGMACEGGCLGGPGALVDTRLTRRYLQESNARKRINRPLDNPLVQAVLGSRPHFLHRVAEDKKEERR